MTISRNLAALAAYVANGGILGQTSSLPSQTGNSGKVLTTNGTVASWGAAGGASTPSAVSDQTNTSTGYFDLPSGTTAQRPVSPDYGAMRYNTTTGFAEVYTVNGWGVFGASPPTITGVTPITYNGEAGTQFTITGTNFTNDAVVSFIDVSLVNYPAATTTFVNSTQLLATTPQDFTVAQGPLAVKVVQASGTNTKTASINTGGSPVWTTASGTIGTYDDYSTAASVSVVATDPDSGATITYSLLSGSLPAGFNLNSGGVISGTTQIVSGDTTYSFTVRATDNAGNTADRAFSIVVTKIYRPNQISGLVGWWDFTTAGNLASVADSSGNGYTMTTGTTPTASTLGNKNAAYFNGSSWLTSTLIPATGASARSLGAIVKNTSGTAPIQHIMHYGTATNVGAYGLCGPSNPGFWGNHYWGPAWTSSTAVNDTENQLLVVAYDGSTDRFYKNGTQIGSYTGGINTGSDEGLKIASRINPPSEQALFTMGEAFAYNKALSATEIGYLKAYANRKYGISI
jgi:hypothetical protein